MNKKTKQEVIRIAEDCIIVEKGFLIEEFVRRIVALDVENEGKIYIDEALAKHILVVGHEKYPPEDVFVVNTHTEEDEPIAQTNYNKRTVVYYCPRCGKTLDITEIGEQITLWKIEDWYYNPFNHHVRDANSAYKSIKDWLQREKE